MTTYISVTMPANPQANVYLPVTGDSKVYEGEKLITPQLNDYRPVIKCRSGSYRFLVK